jgi:hypothetical protein
MSSFGSTELSERTPDTVLDSGAGGGLGTDDLDDLPSQHSGGSSQHKDTLYSGCTVRLGLAAVEGAMENDDGEDDEAFEMGEDESPHHATAAHAMGDDDNDDPDVLDEGDGELDSDYTGRLLRSNSSCSRSNVLDYHKTLEHRWGSNDDAEDIFSGDDDDGDDDDGDDSFLSDLESDDDLGKIKVFTLEQASQGFQYLGIRKSLEQDLGRALTGDEKTFMKSVLSGAFRYDRTANWGQATATPIRPKMADIDTTAADTYSTDDGDGAFKKRKSDTHLTAGTFAAMMEKEETAVSSSSLSSASTSAATPTSTSSSMSTPADQTRTSVSQSFLDQVVAAATERKAYDVSSPIAADVEDEITIARRNTASPPGNAAPGSTPIRGKRRRTLQRTSTAPLVRTPDTEKDLVAEKLVNQDIKNVEFAGFLKVHVITFSGNEVTLTASNSRNFCAQFRKRWVLLQDQRLLVCDEAAAGTTAKDPSSLPPSPSLSPEASPLCSVAVTNCICTPVSTKSRGKRRESSAGLRLANTFLLIPNSFSIDSSELQDIKEIYLQASSEKMARQWMLAVQRASLFSGEEECSGEDINIVDESATTPAVLTAAAVAVPTTDTDTTTNTTTATTPPGELRHITEEIGSPQVPPLPSLLSLPLLLFLPFLLFLLLPFSSPSFLGSASAPSFIFCLPSRLFLSSLPSLPSPTSLPLLLLLCYHLPSTFLFLSFRLLLPTTTTSRRLGTLSPPPLSLLRPYYRKRASKVIPHLRTRGVRPPSSSSIFLSPSTSPPPHC